MIESIAAALALLSFLLVWAIGFVWIEYKYWRDIAGINDDYGKAIKKILDDYMVETDALQTKRSELFARLEVNRDDWRILFEREQKQSANWRRLFEDTFEVMKRMNEERDNG
jgi:hypothetical protein